MALSVNSVAHLVRWFFESSKKYGNSTYHEKNCETIRGYPQIPMASSWTRWFYHGFSMSKTMGLVTDGHIITFPVTITRPETWAPWAPWAPGRSRTVAPRHLLILEDGNTTCQLVKITCCTNDVYAQFLEKWKHQKKQHEILVTTMRCSHLLLNLASMS